MSSCFIQDLAALIEHKKNILNYFIKKAFMNNYYLFYVRLYRGFAHPYFFISFDDT